MTDDLLVARATVLDEFEVVDDSPGCEQVCEPLQGTPDLFEIAVHGSTHQIVPPAPASRAIRVDGHIEMLTLQQEIIVIARSDTPGSGFQAPGQLLQVRVSDIAVDAVRSLYHGDFATILRAEPIRDRARGAA